MQIAPNKTKGILYMLCAALLFSASQAFVKWSTMTLPSPQVLFFRFSITVMLVTPWMLYKKISFYGKNQKLLHLRSLFGLSAALIMFYITAHIPLADVSILTRSTPIWVAMLAGLILKENISKQLVMYLVIASLACGFILKPTPESFNPIALTGVLGALIAAMAYLCIKKLLQTEHAFTIVFHFAAFSALGSLILFGHSFKIPNAQEIIAMSGCGVLATAAQIFMTTAYRYAPISQISSYSYSGVLFATLWGFLFWNEVPDPFTLFGGILMIFAGIGILRIKANPKDVPVTSL